MIGQRWKCIGSDGTRPTRTVAVTTNSGRLAHVGGGGCPLLNLGRAVLLGWACLAAGLATAAERYQADWNSLARHQTPQWLKDAKFGIYTHVSLQTVANLPGNEHKHLHELIDDFKLERFDATEWADLFQRAGARFAGPVSWHGSGFLHWNSDLTRFDVVDMGPHVDLAGELKREITARGMKFLMSFHTGYWYLAAIDRDNPGRQDPRYFDLYGPPHDLDVTDAVPWKNHFEKQSKLSEAHMRNWLARMNEAVTKYQPDIAWVDTAFGGTVRALNTGRYVRGRLVEGKDIYLSGVSERYQRRFIAHFFNTGLDHGKEVAFVYKEHDVPPGIGIRNIENGLLDELAYDTWMTDIDICEPESWFYKPGVTIRSANRIIDILADVVSKNGILLLNVPPKADGTFADAIVRELLEVGDWLRVNGEAIYGTMPWSIYGEGPSRLAKTGHYSERYRNAVFTEKDFRFTQKGPALYAICLGIPEGQVRIRALGSRGRLFEGEIVSVELLGSEAKIDFEQTPEDLRLEMPAGFRGRHACVFKVLRRE